MAHKETFKSSVLSWHHHSLKHVHFQDSDCLTLSRYAIQFLQCVKDKTTAKITPCHDFLEYLGAGAAFCVFRIPWLFQNTSTSLVLRVNRTPLPLDDVADKLMTPYKAIQQTTSNKTTCLSSRDCKKSKQASNDPSLPARAHSYNGMAHEKLAWAVSSMEWSDVLISFLVTRLFIEEQCIHCPVVYQAWQCHSYKEYVFLIQEQLGMNGILHAKHAKGGMSFCTANRSTAIVTTADNKNATDVNTAAMASVTDATIINNNNSTVINESKPSFSHTPVSSAMTNCHMTLSFKTNCDAWYRQENVPPCRFMGIKDLPRLWQYINMPKYHDTSGKYEREMRHVSSCMKQTQDMYDWVMSVVYESCIAVIHTLGLLQQRFGLNHLDTKCDNLLFKFFDASSLFGKQQLDAWNGDDARYKKPPRQYFVYPLDKNRCFYLPNRGFCIKLLDFSMAVAHHVPRREIVKDNLFTKTCPSSCAVHHHHHTHDTHMVAFEWNNPFMFQSHLGHFHSTVPMLCFCPHLQKLDDHRKTKQCPRQWSEQNEEKLKFVQTSLCDYGICNACFSTSYDIVFFLMDLFTTIQSWESDSNNHESSLSTGNNISKMFKTRVSEQVDLFCQRWKRQESWFDSTLLSRTRAHDQRHDYLHGTRIQDKSVASSPSSKNKHHTASSLDLVSFLCLFFCIDPFRKRPSLRQYHDLSISPHSVLSLLYSLATDKQRVIESTKSTMDLANPVFINTFVNNNNREQENRWMSCSTEPTRQPAQVFTSNDWDHLHHVLQKYTIPPCASSETTFIYMKSLV